MNLDAFYNYKNQLMNDLLTNEEIVRLLHDDCKLITDPGDLMYTQVFPYEYIPDTVEHGMTFICCDVDIMSSSYRYGASGVVDPLLLYPYLYIWVFTHKSKLRLPNGGGVRTDRLCNEIAKTINGSRDYGLGTLNLDGVRRYAPIADYQGKVITFRAKDVNRWNPNTKPIPENRVYG